MRPSFLSGGLALSAILVGAPAASVFAAWAPYQVYSQIGTTQAGARLASDGSSGAFIAWSDSRGNAIYVHHALSSNQADPAWPNGGLLLSQNSDNAVIVPDGSGGALVAWTLTTSGRDIYAQHVLASGTTDPAWPSSGLLVCSAPGDQLDLRAVSDGAGGMLLAWTDQRNLGTAGVDLYAHRVRSTGTVDPAWPVNGLAVSTSANDQVEPEAVSDGTGGIIVTWQDLRGGTDYDVFAQRILGMGLIAAGWPAGGLAIADGNGHQLNPVICTDMAGGAIIEWSDFQTGGVFAMRVRSTGALATGWNHNGEPVSASPIVADVFAVVSDGVGGAISSWSGGTSGSPDIYVQKMTSAGDRAWAAGGVAVCLATNQQESPVLANDGAGGALVAWHDHRLQPGIPARVDLYIHHVESPGVVDPAWPLDGARVSFDLLAKTGAGHYPVMIPTTGGEVLVAWDGSSATLQLLNFNSTWTALHPLVVTAANGSVSRSHVGVSYAQESLVTLTAVPSVGYSFTNWSGSATGSTNPLTVIMDGPKAIAANFTGYPVNVVVSPAGTGTVTKSPDQSTYAPGTQVTLTASGAFPFLGWSGDATGATNPLAVTVDAAKNITARFAAYTLTTVVSPAASGTVTKNPNATFYPPGPVTLTAVPVSGYQFSQWTGDASGSTTPVQVDVNGNESVTANFTLIPPSCGQWSLAGPSGPSFGTSAAWDPVNQQVLRFGGGQAPTALYGFTIAAGWYQLSGGPTNRNDAGFVFDSARNRMLVIGGTQNTLPQVDVWALALSGTLMWSQVSTATVPTARNQATSIYDPIRDRVIRFGGWGNGNNSSNEVWSLSLAGSPTWTQLSPGGTTPLGRYGHVAIYDPVRDRMIVHGGFSLNPTAAILGDTWALSLSGTPTWSLLTSAGPAVMFSAAVYDPIRDRMALISGAGGAGVDTDRTWFLALGTPSFWTELPPGPVSLGMRSSHPAVYEPNLDLILAFSGISGATDTKRLDCAGGLWLDAGASQGTVQVIPRKGCYAPGDPVTLVASPANGDMFDHWLGDASGTANPLDVTMNDHKAIFAQMATRTTDAKDAPLTFALRVSPNPSAGPVSIEYSLPREDRVRVSVYDVAGREVARLVDGVRPAGRHVAVWHSAMGRAHPGIYLIRYETPSGTWTRRLALLQ